MCLTGLGIGAMTFLVNILLKKQKKPKKKTQNPKPKQTKQETPNKQTKQKTQKESENLASPEYLFSG